LIPESDAAIVRRTLEGRPEAFEPLVFRYQRKALALARAAGLGPEAAGDAVQEAFLQSFRDLPCLRDPALFGAWFLSIVRNVSRKALERQPPPRSLPGDRPAPPVEEPVERKDFSEYLERKVSQLPEGIREAIFLYYYQGRKLREVARALSITRWGVKRRLKSGREILRGRLWRELEECLRDMLPSTREWRRRGGRIGLLILASVPLSWASRAGVALPRASRAARWTGSMETGALVAAKKTAMSLVLLGLLLIVLGGASWVLLHPRKQTGEDGSVG
jgi:RNA polymerase sigma factor (sigma-70 family)